MLMLMLMLILMLMLFFMIFSHDRSFIGTDADEDEVAADVADADGMM